MDLPNTTLRRDDPRPMASSPRTVSPSRFRASASRRRLAHNDRSALACRRALITGAQDRNSALAEITPYKACSAFTRVAACPPAPPPIRDPLSEGFSHFVTSMTAPVASGWSGCRVGLAPTGKRRLFTAHTQVGHLAKSKECQKGTVRYFVTRR